MGYYSPALSVEASMPPSDAGVMLIIEDTPQLRRARKGEGEDGMGCEGGSEGREGGKEEAGSRRGWP